MKFYPRTHSGIFETPCTQRGRIKARRGACRRVAQVEELVYSQPSVDGQVVAMRKGEHARRGSLQENIFDSWTINFNAYTNTGWAGRALWKRGTRYIRVKYARTAVPGTHHGIELVHGVANLQRRTWNFQRNTSVALGEKRCLVHNEKFEAPLALCQRGYYHFCSYATVFAN